MLLLTIFSTYKLLACLAFLHGHSAGDIIGTENITLTSSAENLLISKEIHPNITYKLNYPALQHPNFYIPQCHSQQHNFTVTEWAAKFGVKQTGNDLGDIIVGTQSEVHSLTLETARDDVFDVYCAMTSHTIGVDPMPGGCNLEFNFKNDPNIHTWYDGFHIWIEHQFAAANDTKCADSQHWDSLVYDMYLFDYENEVGHTAEAYKKALKKFVRAEDIVKHGGGANVWVPRYTRSSQTKPSRVLTSYPNMAVLVALVVTDSRTGTSASYVSTVSYGCDINSNPNVAQYPCQVRWYYYVVATILGVAGLIVGLAGHQLFALEMFVAGGMTFLLLSFILLYLLAVSYIGVVIGCAVLSLVGGLGWWFVWYWFDKASITVILPASVAGILLTSIVFYTPLVNLSAFQNTWQIWLFYAIFIVLLWLLVILRPKHVNIFSCCFVGSYATTAAISFYCYGTLHHIILEFVRRAIITDYYSAVFHAPFLPKDAGLLVCWLVLFGVGLAIQLRLSRDDQGLPSSPRNSAQKPTPNDAGDESARLVDNENESDIRPTPSSYGSVQQ